MQLMALALTLTSISLLSNAAPGLYISVSVRINIKLEQFKIMPPLYNLVSELNNALTILEYLGFKIFSWLGIKGMKPVILFGLMQYG